MRDARSLAIETDIPVSLQPAVQGKLALASEEGVAERLKPSPVRPADATLWGAAGTPEIANRLGWLTIAERTLGEVDDLEAFTESVRADGLRDVVLLGMGGSSLAPEVLRRCFAPVSSGLALRVLDSTDAAAIAAVQGAIEPARTLFIVSSKSGGTIEPLSLFAHFFSLAPSGANFVAITDPGSGLEALAGEHGFRRVFHGDPDIGGRYSALSAFGIVPAALMGVDVRALLEGAAGAWLTGVDGNRPALMPGEDGGEQALAGGVWIGAALSALAQAGRDKLTLLIEPSLPGLGLWLEQLVAESTGKHGTGILPVAEEPPGEPSSYGEDRVFLAITAPTGEPGGGVVEKHARAYAAAGHPVITIPTGGPSELGRLFLLSELAVAVAGWGLQINPFDQPNVQQAKDATNRVLSSYDTTRALPNIPDADDAALRALFSDVSPPEYVAIMGYLQPAEEFDAAVAELRAAIRDARGTTTTFGYGPRFLHSTGQFHKGGPRTGRFLQLQHDGPRDLDVGIPGRSFTFTTLKNAQAIGDLQTLRSLGLPAERVRLEGDDPTSALRALTTRIKEML